MALQFVFGPAGSGKSSYARDYVINESLKRPAENFIMVVPEQFTLTMQRDIVLSHPRKGIMNIDVQSFMRLAFRVFEETKTPKLALLDDEGKNMVIRKVAGDLEAKLIVLKGNMDKIGYIEEVKSVFSEFTQYEIDEDRLGEIMEELPEKGRLYYKLQDLQVLYQGFNDYLRERYLTRESLLERLAEAVPSSELVKNTTFVLDGFTGFTPVQERLLQELLKYSRDVVITATIDEGSNPYSNPHPYQLFALTKKMVSNLQKKAQAASVQMSDPVTLFGKTNSRLAENPVLAHLEENIFRSRYQRYLEEPECIRLFTARNPREEALFVAAQIHKLVREENLRFRDIGVVCGNMDTYREHLSQAFLSYGINGFVDQKRSILNNPYVEYVRSFINIYTDSYSYASLLRFLKTELSQVTGVQVSRLENYCLALGLKQYAKWQKPWTKVLKGQKEEELVSLNATRQEVVALIEGYRTEFRKASKKVLTITEQIYNFCVQERLQERLEIEADKLEEQGSASLAKEYRQVYEILISLLDKFVDLLGDEVMGMAEYSALFDVGLQEAKVGVIPPSTDQVMTGDVQRSRFDELKVLFFIGAGDDCLPGALLTNGLLGESERREFSKLGVNLAPSSSEKVFVQKFYLYTMLAKPRESLYLSYAKSSMSGTSINPSYLFGEMKKLFPALSVTDIDTFSYWEKEYTKASALSEMIGIIHAPERELTPSQLEFFRFFAKNHRPLYEEMIAACFYQKRDSHLLEEVAKALYGLELKGSVTRMEKFANCSYAHFLDYGLRLKERLEFEFEAMDMGNICHEALERYGLKIEENRESWLGLSEEKRSTYLDESLEAAISDYNNDILEATARNRYMVGKMRSLLDRSIWALSKHLEVGDFKPALYEFGFNEGKIDRIDLCEAKDRVYVKVIDYKTGAKSFDVSSLYNGLSLQLMFYLDASLKEVKAEEPQKEVVPAGAFYFQVKDPVVAKSHLEAVQAEKLKELKVDGVINSDGAALAHLDKEMVNESVVLKIRRNKDASFAKGCKVFDTEEIQTMMDYAKRVVEEGKTRILAGEVEASPYSCDYCNYHDVCGFTEGQFGYEKKEVLKADSVELLAEMKEALAGGN
ncbi:ATP-dependent helicase/nuclease subunit B [Lachnospiraceae bacterium PFB1-21]